MADMSADGTSLRRFSEALEGRIRGRIGGLEVGAEVDRARSTFNRSTGPGRPLYALTPVTPLTPLFWKSILRARAG